MSEHSCSVSLNSPPNSLNSTIHDSNHLRLIPQVDLYLFLWGHCYKAYSELRVSRLRNKYREHRQGEDIRPVPAVTTPPRKQVKFQDLLATWDSNLVRDVKVARFVDSGWVRERKVSSVVAWSVPDFSAVLRKENRRPAADIILTPPSKKGSGGMGNGLSAKGSRSASAAEKRGGGVAARKSYASLEEFEGVRR